MGDEVCLVCSFFVQWIFKKKEQAEGESGGEKEQAKSKIDKIEKILGAKIVCACPRCVYKGRKMHENAVKCMFYAIL